ncbi:hypothetical protein HPB50_023258 [Hyalomma asiaticum]|uniref:Uncharacterized protein n=1 Tax=Hyalomma asiaticum TaxID=266040 RepID=A0ACB7S7V3_HYAAI|nr:hypothetical protein HPB50_023258 [Hyalomma asiaticum]
MAKRRHYHARAFACRAEQQRKKERDARICAREQAGGAARRGHPSSRFSFPRETGFPTPSTRARGVTAGPRRRTLARKPRRGVYEEPVAPLVSSWHRPFLEEYVHRLE